MTKFPELFEWVSTHDVTVLRVEDNTLLFKGYAIPEETEGLVRTDRFDTAVTSVLRNMLRDGVEHIMFYDDRVAPCQVYASKEFALGYATGSGVMFIIDLSNGKRVHVSRRK